MSKLKPDGQALAPMNCDACGIMVQNHGLFLHMTERDLPNYVLVLCRECIPIVYKSTGAALESRTILAGLERDVEEEPS